MSSVKIGFIGFGEVASIFSKEMSNKGAEIRIYDILISQKNGLEIIGNRILNNNIQINSLKEVIINSDYIISTVHSQFAKNVANECAQYLKPNNFYIDLNSTSPFVKIEISRIIESSKADFVEGAILGAVGVTGFTNLGLNFSYYSPEIGKASMFKMLRSIFSKGIEAILLEFLISGKKAGMEKDLWKDIISFLSEKSFDKIATNWMQTHAIAYERRYHEITQVVETMKELGIEPIMTSGTEAFFRRSLSLGMKDVFLKKPDSFEKVIDFMEKKTSNT